MPDIILDFNLKKKKLNQTPPLPPKKTNKHHKNPPKPLIISVGGNLKLRAS